MSVNNRPDDVSGDRDPSAERLAAQRRGPERRFAAVCSRLVRRMSHRLISGCATEKPQDRWYKRLRRDPTPTKSIRSQEEVTFPW